ncbi:MAG: ATP-binding protein [Bacteroidota bacterium]
MRRIVATGAESTGKTTLVQALASHYGVLWVPEYARIYADAVEHDLTAADVEPIARGHIAQAEAAALEAPSLLLFDTDLLSTVIYSRHLYGGCPAWVEAAARERAAHLYLLCAPDISWVPDPGQRESPEARATLQPQFEALLREWQLPFVVVSGSRDERITAAIRAVDGLK